MVAWQLDAVRQGTESITLIAYDAEGMAEAVGTMYQIVSGAEPITDLAMPEATAVVPASKSNALPEASLVWQVGLPDRATSLALNGDRLTVSTHDGSDSTVSADGKVLSTKVVGTPSVDGGQPPSVLKAPVPTIPDAIKDKLHPNRIAKFVAAGEGGIAVGYWGGTLQTFDAQGLAKTLQQMPQDITGLAWLGGKLIVGLADGRVVALEVK
jgi:hypothetical protein